MTTKNRDQILGPLQEKWLSLLESKKYPQARGMLCRLPKNGNEPKFCCLGVACLMLGLESKDKDGYRIFCDKGDKNDYYTAKDGMPGNSYHKLGLRDEFGKFDPDVDGQYGDGIDDLSSLNDSCYNFKSIAKIIRKNPFQFFVKSL